MQIYMGEVNRLLAQVGAVRDGHLANNDQIVVNEAVVKQVGAPSVTDEREIDMVLMELDRLPDTREDRVAALKQQIERGEYNVSSEDIADLIIRRCLADNTAS